MLQYFGFGPRDFKKKPMAVHERANWEFYAVLAGRCGPLLAGGEEAPLCAHTLWVFPPGHVHGWRGGVCEVASLHFATVPQSLEELMAGKAYLQAALTSDGVRAVRRLVDELQPHYRRPQFSSGLHQERARLTLAILAVEGSAHPGAARIMATEERRRVDIAVAYFRAQLGKGVSVEGAAAKCGISPQHLRRLFHHVLRDSPVNVLRGVALEKATTLMTQTDMTIEVIALACDFAGPSQFNRAFRREYGLPPGLWRQNSRLESNAAGGEVVEPVRKKRVLARVGEYMDILK